MRDTSVKHHSDKVKYIGSTPIAPAEMGALFNKTNTLADRSPFKKSIRAGDLGYFVKENETRPGRLLPDLINNENYPCRR